MKLYFRTYGHGIPLIILHGVFGSSDNWQTLGKEFSKQYKVYLVDQRNHGNSPHSDKFDYNVMRDDVLELMYNEKIDQAHILGHSMGGKVSMCFATHYPERVNKLIVVDIAPKHYPPHHEKIFRGFHSLKLDQIKSRKEADGQMAQTISDFSVRQFLLKNLTRNGEKFVWKLNLDIIEKNARHIGMPLNEEGRFNGHTLFIAGGNSDYILPEDEENIRVQFPNAELHTIPEAGHWIHAEQPGALRQKVMAFLS